MLLKCDKCGGKDAYRYRLRLDRTAFAETLMACHLDLCDGCRMHVMEFLWSLKGGDDGGNESDGGRHDK